MGSYRVPVDVKSITKSQIRSMTKADLQRYTFDLKGYTLDLEEQLNALSVLNRSKNETMLRLKDTIGLLETLGCVVQLPKV